MHIKCTKCGSESERGAKFCAVCGYNLELEYNHQPHQSFEANKKYKKASLDKRFLAALLDSVISLGFSSPLLILIFFLDDSYIRYENNVANLLFLSSLVVLTYFFIKDGLGLGQSLGKKMLGLMVVNLYYNTHCNKGKSFFRNLISVIILIIPLFGLLIEIITVLLRKDGRKLGDMAANTQVIEVSNFIN